MIGYRIDKDLLRLMDGKGGDTMVVLYEDALREIRNASLPPVGVYLPGGTRLGQDIYLPEGGTWRRMG